MSQLPSVFTPAPHPAERLHELLLAAARVTPLRPAVIDYTDTGELRVLSYGQLEALATGYAAELRGLGLELGDRVVVESDNCGPAVAMMLACSMGGFTFVPVSPDTPDQRLLSVLDAAEPALHTRLAEQRRGCLPGSLPTARFDATGLTVERAPVPRVRHRLTAVTTDTAYMIFTSGTTGRPKGVVMSHRGVLAFYRGMLAHGIVTSADRVASTSPLQFDFSLLDIGLALSNGAALVPVPRGALRFPRRFLRCLTDTGTTHVNGVPSIWRHALRHEPDLVAELTGVRGILFSGEAFPLTELRQLRKLLPGLRVVNCFGPTETMAMSLADVPDPIPDDLERLSIGNGYRGAELLLIDDDGRPVDEVGVVGEIFVRAPSLFSGYWGDPEATRGALVPDPLDPRTGQLVYRSHDLAYRGPDGELYFVGRSDSQVKIRGNRVELGEIERTLRECPGVVEAAVLLLKRPGREDSLGAFVVMSPTAADFDERTVSVFCRESLPDYMVPGEVHVLPELPVNHNGKTDRAALAARAAA
ncbi:AMP-binding protein [Catellatospora tritici]|uniref:AMP-binding protein n=1 Tax=Catellatospora tritici TaxID=2851566 RepID=UPI001C2D4F89|nr:AMP-binding protein [Catellatospora tritici]MBV1855123.1 AMP-binding protein [Catellatospora tritici]